MTTTSAAAAAARALQSASAPTKSESTPERQPAPRMATFWRRMTDIYGHRWTAPHGESSEAGSGDTWAKGLAGVTPQQLAAGLEACIVRADPWPPTLPEFRALCFGIPSLLQVREDLARAGAQRQSFTLLVCRHLDGWAYRHADQHAAERMLREAYADAREAVLRGEPLPEPVPELEHTPAPPKPADPEVARAALAEIGEMLGASKPEASP